MLVCFPLARSSRTIWRMKSWRGGVVPAAGASAVPSGPGGMGVVVILGGEEPTEKYQFIRAPRPGQASGRRSGRFSVSVMLVLLFWHGSCRYKVAQYGPGWTGAGPPGITTRQGGRSERVPSIRGREAREAARHVHGAAAVAVRGGGDRRRAGFSRPAGRGCPVRRGRAGWSGRGEGAAAGWRP